MRAGRLGAAVAGGGEVAGFTKLFDNLVVGDGAADYLVSPEQVYCSPSTK